MFNTKRSNKHNNEANPAPTKKQLSPGFKKFLIFLLIMQVAGPILVLIFTQALGGLTAHSMKKNACTIVDVVDENCIVIEQNGVCETVDLLGVNFDVDVMKDYIGSTWYIQEDYAVPEVNGVKAVYLVDGNWKYCQCMLSAAGDATIDENPHMYSQDYWEAQFGYGD